MFFFIYIILFDLQEPPSGYAPLNNSEADENMMKFYGKKNVEIEPIF